MIYMIAAHDLHDDTVFAVKIGVSDSPDARMKDLQGGCPLRLSLLCTADGDERNEHKLHASHRSDRLRGEWFAASPSVLRTARVIAETGMLPPDNYQPEPQTFSGRLQNRRLALGRSAREVGRAAGIAESHVGLLENGPIKSPRMVTIGALAKALECKPSWLAFGSGKAPEEPDDGAAA